MATIDSLVEATVVGDNDLLLIDQGGEGKKLKKGNLKVDADNVLQDANGGSVQDFIDGIKPISILSNFEVYRRSYAEAGYNLVDGSFEAGGTLVNANDVLLQECTGKAFSGPAGTVAAGANPASGGFVDRSNEPSFWSTGRGRLTISTEAPTGIPLENEEWVMIGNVG